ncbi:unnamed protein product [Dicrocoelium dendriticum]|nr:unnamed protein product [Dicrocoelium dendriticum]
MNTWINCTKLPWEEALPGVLLADRASKQSTTKVATFVLRFARQPRIPFNTLIIITQKWEIPATHHELLEATARRETRSRQARNKRNYDARYATDKWKTYSVGEQVTIRNQDRPELGGPGARKFRKPWKGPYAALDRKGENLKLTTGGRNALLMPPYCGRGTRENSNFEERRV